MFFIQKFIKSNKNKWRNAIFVQRVSILEKNTYANFV